VESARVSRSQVDHRLSLLGQSGNGHELELVPCTLGKRPARQSSRARSMRSRELLTKVPVDVALAERRAAEQHHPRSLDGGQAHRTALAQHQKRAVAVGSPSTSMAPSIT